MVAFQAIRVSNFGVQECFGRVQENSPGRVQSDDVQNGPMHFGEFQGNRYRNAPALD